MVTYNYSANIGEVIEKGMGDTDCKVYFVEAK